MDNLPGEKWEGCWKLDDNGQLIVSISWGFLSISVTGKLDFNNSTPANN